MPAAYDFAGKAETHCQSLAHQQASQQALCCCCALPACNSWPSHGLAGDRHFICCPPNCAGEAAALFVQNWWLGSVAKWFMKLTILDMYHTLPKRHQPWFRETRQAWFNTTFEEVRTASRKASNSGHPLSGRRWLPGQGGQTMTQGCIRCFC